MPYFPVSGLESLDVTAHKGHHSDIHDILNIPIDAGEIGATLVKVGSGATPAALGGIHPHYNLPNHRKAHTHSAAGVLSFAVDSGTRVVDVTASANITGLSVAGMELLGGPYGRIIVRLSATASITVDLSGVGEVTATYPSSMASGQTISGFYIRSFV